MKRKCFIVAVLMTVLTVMPVKAALVTNGGFDVDAAEWNATGGGTVSWASDHLTEAGNGFVTLATGELGSTDWAWAVWYQVGLEMLDEWGIPAGTTISLSADIKEISGNGNLEDAALKIESWSDSGLVDDYEEAVVVTTEWANYSIDYTINPSATGVKCVLVHVPESNDPATEYGFDNVAIKIPGGTPALKPVPIVGGALSPSNPVLSWVNPDPNNPGDTITADVFILESDVILTTDPNLGPINPEDGVEQVAFGTADESVDLSLAGYPVQEDKYYYWAVHITDPTVGVVEGFIWNFQTFDGPPTDVSAGPDQYVWLTMDDGTPNDDKVTFTLTGTYTDDGESPVDTTWALDEELTETDPATVVTITNPNSATTTVKIDNTGWFYFDFTVSDSVASISDTVNIGVYVDACEAAKEDPDDIAAAYPDGHGDIDGDCDTDLEDFALLAASWIECMSDKLDCAP